jgi:hypothetical protein
LIGALERFAGSKSRPVEAISSMAVKGDSSGSSGMGTTLVVFSLSSLVFSEILEIDYSLSFFLLSNFFVSFLSPAFSLMAGNGFEGR